MFLAAPEQEGNGSVGNNTGGQHNISAAQIIGNILAKNNIETDIPTTT